jgi:hypothetical protein
VQVAGINTDADKKYFFQDEGIDYLIMNAYSWRLPSDVVCLLIAGRSKISLPCPAKQSLA